MNDRQTALDEFATHSPVEGQLMMPAVQTMPPPPALVHGAQMVLVPRNVQKVLQTINQLAQAAGPDWYYRIPFKDRKSGKTTFVEGPSIKLANDVARIYGSCEVNPWVSSEGLDYWEFTARFIDLESGYAMTRLFRQRKDASKIGGGDSGRNMEGAFAIGVSKAIRNVVINALQTYCDYAFEQARNALVDRIGKDIERWRKETADRIGAMVDLKRVEAVVGRSVKDWLAPDIASVVAMGKAIKDGMATVDETFPHIQRQEHASTEEQLNEASEVGRSTSVEEGAAETGSDASSRMQETETSTADAAPTKSPAGDKKLMKEAISKMLALATDESLNREQRLSALETTAANWETALEPEFFEALVKASVSVAKGFTDVKDAKKTLETFK